MNAEFIVKVLLCHPSHLVEETKELKAAKNKIKKRYRELRRDMDFTSAEIQAKREWLEDYIYHEKKV